MRKSSILIANLLLCLFIIMCSEYVRGQTTLAKKYSGPASDTAYSIQQTTDGGYIITGETYSFGAGNDDTLVMKLNSSGNIVWRRTFGGTEYEWSTSGHQTTDGGYIIATSSNSYGTGVFAGGYDILILKLNSTGNIVWRRTFGGAVSDEVDAIQQTTDGGYIVVGRTDSYGAGSSDVLILKLNTSGNIIWRRTFGGTNSDWGKSIQQTSDGGYIVIGGTSSYGAGLSDVLVIKLDSAGNPVWKRTVGGTQNDYPVSIQQTSDGGYSALAYTWSFGATSWDIFVFKLNSLGNVIWKRTFGGTQNEYAYAIDQSSDGGAIIVGDTYSFGAGESDILLIKLNSSGNISWRRTFGGIYYDSGYSVQQTSDSGYVVGGYIDPDGSSQGDVLLLKFDANGNLPGCALTAPNLTITVPAVSLTAPALTATAPAIAVAAPVINVSAPAFTISQACP